MDKQQKLMSALANVSGASFISIDTLTTETLTGGKKNPMQGRVTKKTTGASVMVFQNKNGSAYQAMVERRLAAEGKDPSSFTLGERKWGERIKNTPFITHKGELYLEVIFLKAGKSEYFLDGKPIAKSDIQGIEKSAPNEESQGGLDNKVVIRTFRAESITAIRVDKQEHIL